MSKPKKEKLPWFPFYSRDWLTSSTVAGMTLAEQGVYLRLLCYCWESGDCSLPNDPKALFLLVRPQVEEPVDFQKILQLFIAHPTKNGWQTHSRLYSEYEKSKKIQRDKRIAGAIGALSRWHATAMPLPIAEPWHNDAHSHTHPTLTEKKEKKPSQTLPLPERPDVRHRSAMSGRNKNDRTTQDFESVSEGLQDVIEGITLDTAKRNDYNAS